MPAPSLPEIEKIFLSATARDCRAYRTSLKAAIEGGVPAAKIHLQEDWADGAVFVVDACRDRVRANDAYFGLFGHRYGWVPPGFTESITALEFAWATEHWAMRTPPIFILLPEIGSAADEALQGWANEELAKDFAEAAPRERSRQAQRDFIARVRTWAGERFIVHFASEQQLREKGLSCVQTWNLNVWKVAAAGPRRSAGGIPGEELGRIGRDAQVRVLEHVLGAVRTRAGARWAALAVHGRPNHGQRQFADFLAAWDEWEDVESLVNAQPDHPEDPAALARWACGMLKQPIVAGQEIDALAQRIAARLERGEELVFLLRSFGSAPERWRRFARGFWQPLAAALAARTGASAKGRLLWIVVDHASCDCGDAAIFWTGAPDDPALDPSRIVPVPELAPLEAAQVERWLKACKDRGIALGHERRREIAEAATTPNGRPVDVYDRLERENFWNADS